MVGSSPPLLVVPVILLLFLLSLSSPVLSQSPSDNNDKPSSIESTLSSISTACTVTALTLSAINPQGTVYLSNITYFSITMPPTAPSGFKLKILQHIDYRTCAVDAFVGDDSNTCPGPTKNYMSSSGGCIDFSLLNHTTNTYYIGLRATNCTSLQVIFQIFAVCPSYCTGPGAHCSSTTGCFCGNNYYNPLDGCFITGPCDPIASYQYVCYVPNGYGNQTCHVNTHTNTTYLGPCKVAGCNPQFLFDHKTNSCQRGGVPPPPPGPYVQSSSSDDTEPWYQVGSLGTAASISIWCAEVFGVLVVLTVAVVIVLRRRPSQSLSPYNELDDERL